jgi:hypothetical protein
MEKVTDDRIQKEHEDTKIQPELMYSYFYKTGIGHHSRGELSTEPVFLKVYGAQESIPRNEFRQPM